MLSSSQQVSFSVALEAFLCDTFTTFVSEYQQTLITCTDKHKCVMHANISWDCTMSVTKTLNNNSSRYSKAHWNLLPIIPHTWNWATSHSESHRWLKGFFTFRVSRRPREMYCGHARLCVCLSVRGRMPTLFADPDATWESGRECPLVVHYLADLQSVHGLRCYGNTMEMRGRAQQ